MFFITWYHGPVAATVDDLVADERATTGQAGFIFAMHFFGTAPSSYVVGVIADGVGLRLALLVPTVAIGVAALVNMRAWPTAAADIGNRDRAAL
jgi:MFS transporter, Spinster family, sphingosine-1-phosphate transporter